jgi:Spy/CpxP family protein refolding chaperone
MGSLFPPELIMQNQQALRLTDEQRAAMLTEIQRTQTQAAPIAWRLQAAMEQLGAVVRQDHVDEVRVLAQLDSALALEREMKRAQITLLVRLKNQLTPEQQAYLRGRMSRPND